MSLLKFESQVRLQESPLSRPKSITTILITVREAVENKLIYEVSIVVPIYNGEKYIETKLESLTGIEEVNYEVIIALNKCTDKSEELIDSYGVNIKNLRIIRHSSYLEGAQNLQSGVQAACGHFIFVSAVDDVCDKEFYREAIEILNEKETVCAVSPMTRFDDNSHGNKAIGFELLGDAEERVRTLFKNIRYSHGIYYSLIRRNVATALYRNCSKEYSFIGGDWLFDLKLALEGEVLRAKRSECVFGTTGASREKNYLYSVDTTYFKTIFPYSNLVVNVIKLSRGQKLRMKVLLFKISLGLLWGNLHRYMFSFPQIRNLWNVVKWR
jgi:glycosyltransferase involved in cell wall biosynthesis